MSIDASGTKYWSDRGGVVLVNDPLETIEEVARAYGIRWLVLDAGDSVAAVAPILDRDERPAWIGPAVYTEPREVDETAPAADGRFSVGVYPVCLEPADTRCAAAASVAAR